MMTVLLAAGCASALETAETIACPKEETAARTTAPETTSRKETSESVETEESVPEIDGEELLAEFLKNTRNFRGENMPPETENPTLAEEIYRLLYDFSDLEYYLWYCIPESRYGFAYEPETGRHRYLLPENDDFLVIDQTWINSLAEPEDEHFVILEPIYYSRVRYGEIKTVDEYYRRMSCVATWEYMALDCPWLGGRLQSSQGNLYVSDFEQRISGTNSDSVLNKITKIDEDTLRLEFTAAYYYAETRIENEDYSVTISKGKSYCRDREPDGKWRVDRCDSVNAGDLSCEIIRGGINGESPKTDLPEQIERCLKESGLM